MKGRILLFLDFDGVICDSARECFESSFSAYNVVHGKKPVYDGAALEQFREQFNALRPYIRNSEDYLYIQETIDHGIEIRSQAEFDEHIERSTRERKSEYRRAFYDVRSENFKNNPTGWLNSNPIYPHMKKPLAAYSGNTGLYILSTKKIEFIEAILSHNSMAITKEKILFSAENEKKLSRITKLLDMGAGVRAVFVDDQVEHLRANEDRRIETCLPLWGYIEKSCVDVGNDIRVINESDMMELFHLLD